MKRKRFTEEQIICEHEAGAKAGELARKHGISEATLYHWKAICDQPPICKCILGGEPHGLHQSIRPVRMELFAAPGHDGIRASRPS
jgi:putative transposase